MPHRAEAQRAQATHRICQTGQLAPPDRRRALHVSINRLAGPAHEQSFLPKTNQTSAAQPWSYQVAESGRASQSRREASSSRILRVHQSLFCVRTCTQALLAQSPIKDNTSTGDIQSASSGSLSDFLAKHCKGIAYFRWMSVLLKLSNPSCVYLQALAIRSSV